MKRSSRSRGSCAASVLSQSLSRRVDRAVMRRAQRDDAGDRLVAAGAQVGAGREPAHAVPDQRDLRRAGADAQCRHRLGDAGRVVVDGRERRLEIDRIHRMAARHEACRHRSPQRAVAEVAVDQQHRQALVVRCSGGERPPRQQRLREAEGARRVGDLADPGRRPGAQSAQDTVSGLVLGPGPAYGPGEREIGRQDQRVQREGRQQADGQCRAEGGPAAAGQPRGDHDAQHELADEQPALQACDHASGSGSRPVRCLASPALIRATIP